MDNVILLTDAIPKTTSKEMTASLLPITKRITQLQQKSTRDRTLHLTTKSKTTSHSGILSYLHVNIQSVHIGK